VIRSISVEGESESEFCQIKFFTWGNVEFRISSILIHHSYTLPLSISIQLDSEEFIYFEKMKKEAEKFASEDRKQKEMIDIRNKTDNLIYTCEKAIKDAGDKIKPESKKDIEEKIEELKKIKDGKDLEALKKG